MDQKRTSAFRRWLDRRKLRRIELLERKNIARTTLRDFRQQQAAKTVTELDRGSAALAGESPAGTDGCGHARN